MRHIALEGRCFVLSANQYATKENYPESHAAQHHEKDEIIEGGSMIVSPSGEVLPDHCVVKRVTQILLYDLASLILFLRATGSQY